jgi:hypothetical protein
LIFLLEPLNGIVLGPYRGFLSTLMGVLAGHVITPRGVEEFLFTLGAPIGALVAGYAVQGKWKRVLVYYASLLIFYFATPVAWQLPLYGMWDVYLATLCVAVMSIVVNRVGHTTMTSNVYRLLALSAFVGLEADVLFRIFLFIPGQTYHLLYGLPVEVLQVIWVSGALMTPIKVAASILLTAIVGRRVMKITSIQRSSQRS